MLAARPAFGFQHRDIFPFITAFFETHSANYSIYIGNSLSRSEAAVEYISQFTSL
jgi:hypothetical protein